MRQPPRYFSPFIAFHRPLPFRQTACQVLVATSIATMFAMQPTAPAWAADFPAEIDLLDLDGNNGVVLKGINVGDRSSFSISNAGDVNGDGVDDLIIGEGYDNPKNNRSGLSYVVFGGNHFGSAGVVQLSELNGENGFFISGIRANDMAGAAVSNAGDVNGDGVDDLVIGAFGGNRGTGASYVVFGGASIGRSGELVLPDLDGTNGYVINGIDAGDGAANVSHAGDVNGDGVDDLIIGAATADIDGKQAAGEAYVVFGGRNVGNSGSLELSDLNGQNGLVIQGVGELDFTGESVSAAGDVNADGVGDVLIGAPRSNVPGRSYVVFGGPDVGGNGVLPLSALDGNNGFVLAGISRLDNAAEVSSAGDVNNDGVDDLLIGSDYGDPPGRFNAGQSFVVFGRSGLGRSGWIRLSNINGVNGFAINGENAFDESGNSVSNAGDVNGDGVDDLLISAHPTTRN